MRRHYTDPGFRKKGTTACGLPLAGYKGVKGGGVDPETTEDMDRVTCKRCLASWARFVKKGGAG